MHGLERLPNVCRRGRPRGALRAGGAAPAQRDALLTHLARRAPAWRALFLSALFALAAAWTLLTALAWAPAAGDLAGGSPPWGPWAPGGAPAWAAPAWLVQLRASLLRPPP